MTGILLIALIISIALVIVFDKPKKKKIPNYKNRVLSYTHDKTRGIIITDRSHTTVKIEGKRYYMETRCVGCGSDEVKENGECSHCGNQRA